MKNKLTFILLTAAMVIIGACRQPSAAHRENGWYRIVDGQLDSIALTPIVTVKDFVELRLDTDFYGKVGIAGRVNERKRKVWADATEQSVGQRIGFVYNDSVICDPRVNMRIESGNFQISNRQGTGIAELYHRLLEEKRDSLDAMFEEKGWEIDAPSDRRQRDSLINMLDYGEAFHVANGSLNWD